MIPPGIEDLHNLHYHVDLLSQTSTWIADSAVAAADAASDVADAAAAAAKEDSWWENYIRLYRNGLEYVHDNIVDEPLRKMGFTQTWGVSIFLFTAGELFFRGVIDGRRSIIMSLENIALSLWHFFWMADQ